MEELIRYETELWYPNGFFDYSSGVEINDEEINEWILECWKVMEKEKKDTYYISSGNALVYLVKGDDFLRVIVCKDYQELEIPLKDIIKKKRGKK